MISGLKSHYDSRHFNRLFSENKHFGSSTEIIKVPTKTLSSILEELKINNVNYLSIDVEGAEKQVIESIDFNNVFIDIIGFENNYLDVSKPIIDYLKLKNYIVLNYKGTDIMMIKANSTFLKI